MMTKRECLNRNCKVLTDVDTDHDIDGLAEVRSFCPFHERVYRRTMVLFGLKGKKIGKDSIDMSNHMWRTDKKGWREVERRAIKWVKKHGKV